MTSRTSTAAPILAVLAIVVPLLLVGAYVAGYLALGDYYEGVEQGTLAPGTVRCYEHEWQRTLFAPAGWIEQHMTGRVTVITSPIEDLR
jgi:hypothetical protein